MQCRMLQIIAGKSRLGSAYCQQYLKMARGVAVKSSKLIVMLKVKALFNKLFDDGRVDGIQCILEQVFR